ncbi:spore germination protein [Paenibacillus sp. SI8]|uniref:spore germination protein n=1 Tax=unclassified Paenibacillus TaxID=185978 RepID=UPI0034668F97
MPSIVVNININSNSGTVNFGDTLEIAPKNSSKSVSGPGGSTGNVVNTVNGTTINNVLDPSIIDNSIA